MGKFLLFIGLAAGAVWWLFFTPISEFKTVPSSFNFVFYINMDSAMKNQYVKKGLNDSTSLAKLPPEGRKMVSFVRKLMVNSIDDLYIAANVKDSKRLIAFINFKEKTEPEDFIKEIKTEFEIDGEPELKKYKYSEYYLLDSKGFCLAKNSEKQFIIADETTMKRSLNLKKNGGTSLADNSDLMKVCNNGRNKSSFWFAGEDKKRTDMKAIMVDCNVQNYNMEVSLSMETNKMMADAAEAGYEANGKDKGNGLVALKDFARNENMITLTLLVNISKMKELNNFKF